MKKGILLIAVFAMLIYFLPVVPLFFFPAQGSGSPVRPAQSGETAPSAAVPEPALPPAAENSSGSSEEPLLILDERSGEVMKVSIRDFVRGAVAAEMPVTYPAEALRAQAIAAHSYALAVKERRNPADPALKGAYFSANPAQRLGYITETAMHAMWGDAYAENSALLDAAVDPVLDRILTYDGHPALTCYHAISAGRTESAAAVWGGNVPYLVPADSIQDMSCPDFEQHFTVTKQELRQDLEAAFPGMQLEGDAAQWFGAPVLSPSGYVQSITAGGISCAGTAIRSALHLRSAAFSIRWTEDHLFEITTRGYGHGVGMSQYGAGVLAQEGKSHQEILALYYPGTALSSAAGAGITGDDVIQ